MLRMCKCSRTHLDLGCSSVNPKPALPGRRRCERMKSRYLMRSANHTQSRHNQDTIIRNQDEIKTKSSRIKSQYHETSKSHATLSRDALLTVAR